MRTFSCFSCCSKSTSTSPDTSTSWLLFAQKNSLSKSKYDYSIGGEGLIFRSARSCVTHFLGLLPANDRVQSKTNGILKVKHGSYHAAPPPAFFSVGISSSANSCCIEMMRSPLIQLFFIATVYIATTTSIACSLTGSTTVLINNN